jgi:hypothetical protein
MIDHPRPADPRWLPKVEMVLGETQLAARPHVASEASPFAGKQQIEPVLTRAAKAEYGRVHMVKVGCIPV